MSNVVALRLPESHYQRSKKMAKDEGISLNQYAQLTLAEKLAREETLQMLEGRFNTLEQSLWLRRAPTCQVSVGAVQGRVAGDSALTLVPIPQQPQSIQRHQHRAPLVADDGRRQRQVAGEDGHEHQGDHQQGEAEVDDQRPPRGPA